MIRSTIACTLLSLLLLLTPHALLAQDEEGRFVGVLNVQGKDASKVQKDFTGLFADSPHILYTEDDLITAAQTHGGSAGFWDDPTMLAKVAKAEGIDALVLPELNLDKKKYTLVVTVFDARQGTIIGQFEQDLGKKAKIEKKAGESIKAELRPLIAETGKIIEPVITTVKLKLASQPQGATVLRDGVSIGITPVVIEVDRADGEEMWEISYQDKPAGFLTVNLSKDGTYSYDIPPELLEQIDDEKPRGEPGATVLLGQGRPIIELAAGVALTGRSLDVTVDQGNPLSYSSSIYPVFTFDLLFFPFAIFTANDYLASIGLFGNFGFGSLESAIPVDPNAPVPEACSGSDTAGQVNCSTSHTQFELGAAYRLLFNSSETHPERLDPAGMALTIKAAYQWLVFDVAENLTYEGHGYQGLMFGVDFGMPLGLDELRLDAGFAYTQMLSFGDGTMIANWGESASGWGISANAGVSYDIVVGVFAKLLYELNYFNTAYGGTGCQDALCTIPVGAAATDMYNQVSVQFGWRLQ